MRMTALETLVATPPPLARDNDNVVRIAGTRVRLEIGLTRSHGQLIFSPSAELYFFCFWFPIFAFGENWKPKASRFPAAAGEKDVVLKRPRKSWYSNPMVIVNLEFRLTPEPSKTRATSLGCFTTNAGLLYLWYGHRDSAR